MSLDKLLTTKSHVIILLQVSFTPKSLFQFSLLYSCCPPPISLKPLWFSVFFSVYQLCPPSPLCSPSGVPLILCCCSVLPPAVNFFTPQHSYSESKNYKIKKIEYLSAFYQYMVKKNVWRQKTCPQALWMLNSEFPWRDDKIFG